MTKVIVKLTATDSIKQVAKYNIAISTNQGAIGDGAKVINYNYAPLPRTIDKHDTETILSLISEFINENDGWNKSIKIIFSLPIQDGESFKYAYQIASLLRASGFSNIEARYAIFQGIRTNNFAILKNTDETNLSCVEIQVFPQNIICTDAKLTNSSNE